jgi:prepilin-type N-terminal cleavage/methylation domain-containing protein
MKFFNRKNNNGFTLVEMMVAIAVFSIVMVTAMSALLNVVDANNKARSLKTAINNISFALEGISKDMRMGTDYSCGKDGSLAGDCPSGGDIIRYRSVRADMDSSLDKHKYAYYKFSKDNNGIGFLEECLGKSGIICGFNGPFTPITSTEVDLTSVNFYVLGVNNSNLTIGNKTQPRMIMTVSGVAGTKEKIKTTFDLQTSVSQLTRVY